MFTAQFNKYACPRDTIVCTIGKFEFTATIRHDSDTSIDDFDCYDLDAIARYYSDCWFFVGIVLSAQYNGIDLECNESLWGIDCNFGKDNSYLLEVANELLSQYDYENARKDMIQKLS